MAEQDRRYWWAQCMGLTQYSVVPQRERTEKTWLLIAACKRYIIVRHRDRGIYGI